MECDLKMEMIFENSRRSSISSRVATNAAPWLEDPIAPDDEWRHCDAIARHQKGGSLRQWRVARHGARAQYSTTREQFIKVINIRTYE